MSGAKPQKKLNWTALLTGAKRRALEETFLPEWLPARRWFGAKARLISEIKIAEQIPLGDKEADFRLLFLRVTYADGGAELYLLPAHLATEREAAGLAANPGAVIARFEGEDAVVVDAVVSKSFRSALFAFIEREGRRSGRRGVIYGSRGNALRSKKTPSSRVLGVEQSNTSIIYGDRFFLKLYRKLEEGVNPDAELIRFLSEEQQFRHVPPFAGSLEYREPRAQPCVLGLLLSLVPNRGDAWKLTLESLRRFFVRIQKERPALPRTPPPGLFDLVKRPENAAVVALAGATYVARARLLAIRTAEMHLALAAGTSPEFAPEPFTPADEEGLADSMGALLKRMLGLARRQRPSFDGETGALLDQLLGSEKTILQRHAQLTSRPIPALKTRIHGDYHLGQVLNTGKDFVIIDFEGEPSRPLNERKRKKLSLTDVAGMIRSFHYAPHFALGELTGLSRGERSRLGIWAQHWAAAMSRRFLQSYRATMKVSPVLPQDSADLQLLLELLLLDKAIYEVVYELNNRPAWVAIPARGILALLTPMAHTQL